MIPPIYSVNDARYDSGMKYRRCGRSGIVLPEISLGFWHNFGAECPLTNSKAMVHYAFDHGVTHFDLANNYGPPYGSAETTFGQIMEQSMRPYRDEMFISSKAGYDMWPGPYGIGGSRKYLMASLDQSLKRMHLDYVDLFYSHRYDPDTPIEETLQALVDIVRAGKALYVGISRWPLEAARAAYAYLADRDVPCLIYQGKYNILDRSPATDGILDLGNQSGVGFIGFSPLAQGLLTDRYLHGIPADSRMAHSGSLSAAERDRHIDTIRRLNALAAECSTSTAALALAWVLSDCRVTSVIVGARDVDQLAANLRAADIAPLSPEILDRVEAIINSEE